MKEITIQQLRNRALLMWRIAKGELRSSYISAADARDRALAIEKQLEERLLATSN